MASSLSLSEDDIHGASFGTGKPAELRNGAPRIWLKCRGDKCKELKTNPQPLKRWVEMWDRNCLLFYCKLIFLHSTVSMSILQLDKTCDPDPNLKHLFEWHVSIVSLTPLRLESWRKWCFCQKGPFSPIWEHSSTQQDLCEFEAIAGNNPKKIAMTDLKTSHCKLCCKASSD